MAKFKYIPNRVIDTNGISDGASIAVYQSGTTTPVSIYSEEELTTPLPNPLPVVAGAPVPAFYFDGPASGVRVKVTDASGATVDDDDPYNPPANANDLASTDSDKGAALVGIEGGGTVQDFIDGGGTVLKSSVIEVDFIPRLQAAVAISDTVTCLGDFPLASVFGSTLVGKHIRGVPGHTTFTVDPSLTAGDIFDLGEGSTIEDVEAVGPMTTPDPTSTSWFNTIDDALALGGVGDLSFARLRGIDAWVNGCAIRNFPGWAIQTTKNNTASAVTSGTHGCRIYNNYGGINIPEESEYLSFADTWVNSNIIGVNKAGGNNIFANCHVDHNRVNFITRLGLNNSHGGFTGGSLNHAKFATVISDSITNGDLFTGVNIFDGGPKGFYIRNSIGLNVTGCLFGRLPFYCVGDGTGSDATKPGTNKIHGNVFNLNSLGSGATNKVYRNYNEGTGLSDPTTLDNCVFRGNEHMEGDSRRDTSGWDPMWINDYLFPDSNGFRYGETTPGTSASRFVSGTPIDGVKQLGAGGITGAIAIELAVPGFNNSQITLDISIATPTAGRSARIELSAYAITASSGSWSGATWIRVDGYNYKVRLGRTAAGKPVVYIGELATVFTNTLVRINNVTVQVGAYALPRYWQTRYVIRSEASAFENVTQESPDSSGTNAPLDYAGDLNIIATTSTVYAISATNRPGSENGFCETVVRQAGSSIRKQMYTSIASAAVHVRYTSTGDAGWSAWTAL